MYTTIEREAKNLGSRVLIQEYDRLLTEKFINGLNDNELVDEVLKEVTTLQDIEDTTSECTGCKVEKQVTKISP